MMKLKPIHDQVVVITGASSGIGLATAKLAADKGAAVVLAARSKNAIEEIAHSLVRLAPVHLLFPVMWQMLPKWSNSVMRQSNISVASIRG
jgi:NADP-dependent 3-hydroxy acid dehydrogenase YdfG